MSEIYLDACGRPCWDGIERGVPPPNQCVRCGTSDFYEGKHTNWDERGPICSDCWLEEAELIGADEYREGMAQLELDLKECREG